MAEMITIDDSTADWTYLNPTIDGEVKRCESLGMWSGQPIDGYAGTFEDLISVPMIPESEWADRIRQQELDGTRLIDLANDMGMAIRNQRSSSSCWGFGTCRSAEYAMLQTGINMYISPFSVTAPINNWRDRGGWGDSALSYMAKEGWNTADEWPCESGWQRNFRDYYTDENRALAKKRLVVEYYKLRTGAAGWPEVVSCILAGKAVAVGFNYWRHLVCATWLTTDMKLGVDNSWGPGWSDGGRGLLSGRKKYADGAVVITAVKAI